MSVAGCLKKISPELAKEVQALASTYAADTANKADPVTRAAAELHEQAKDATEKARRLLIGKGHDVSTKAVVTPAQRELARLMKEATDAGMGKEQANVLVGTLFNRISKTMSSDKVSPEKILGSFTIASGTAAGVKSGSLSDAGFYSALKQGIEGITAKALTPAQWAERIGYWEVYGPNGKTITTLPLLEVDKALDVPGEGNKVRLVSKLGKTEELQDAHIVRVLQNYEPDKKVAKAQLIEDLVKKQPNFVVTYYGQDLKGDNQSAPFEDTFYNEFLMRSDIFERSQILEQPYADPETGEDYAYQVDRGPDGTLVFVDLESSDIWEVQDIEYGGDAVMSPNQREAAGYIAAEYDLFMGSKAVQPTNPTHEEYIFEGGENYRERVISVPGSPPYTDSHYGAGQPGYVFHIRLQDFGKTTVIEEIQSDRFQKARDYGFKGDPWILARATAEDVADPKPRMTRLDGTKLVEGSWIVRYPNGVVAGHAAPGLSERSVRRAADIKLDKFRVDKAPYAKTWELQAFKRALYEAAVRGQDKIAWTQGIEQVNRYSTSLRTQVSRMTWKLPPANPAAPWAVKFLDEQGMTSTEFLDLHGPDRLDRVLGSKTFFDALVKEWGYLPAEFAEFSDAKQDNLRDRMYGSDDFSHLYTDLVDYLRTDSQTQGLKNVFIYAKTRLINVEVNKAGFITGTDTGDQTLVGKPLKSFVGADSAKKIMASETGTLEGDDLTIGAEGFKAAYDNRLVNEVDKYVKRWGVKAEKELLAYHGDSKEAFEQLGERVIEENPDLTMDELIALINQKWVDADYPASEHKVWAVPITEKMRQDILTVGQPLYDESFGAFTPFNLGGVITLFENARPTTPFHELGHGIYQLWSTMIHRDIASEQVRRDFDTITRWLRGIDYEKEWELSVSKNPDFVGKTWETLTDDERNTAMAVAENEYFARGFTRYLYEGQAPTRELDGVFARLRAWMREVYKAITDFHVKLNPEVRAVFDRMLTTEYNVNAAAHELGIETWAKKDLTALGMAPEDQMYFKKLLGDAKIQAEARVERAQNRGLRSLRKQWREQALKSLESDPTQELVEILRKGYGLDYEQFMARYGEEAAKGLPKGVLKKDGRGRTLEEVAFERGYENPEQALNALWSWRPAKEIAIEVANQKVEEHMNSFKAIDFLLASEEYSAALELLDKYLRSTSPLSQEAQLQQRLQSPRPNRTTITRQVLQAHAKMTLESTAISEATSSKYMTATKMAQIKERQAVSRGDFAEAARYNELARLNFEMAKEAVKIKNEVTKALQLAKSVNRAKRGLIAENYHRAAAKVALRFGLTQKTRIEIDKAPVLANLLNPREDALLETGANFSDFLTQETVSKSYKDLTVAEFGELVSLLKYLKGTGRMLLDDRLHISKFKAADFVSAIAKNAAILPDFKVRKEGTWARAIQDGVSKYWAENSALLWIIRALDGYDALKGKPGFLETHFINPLEKAWANKAKGRAQVSETFLPAIQQLTKSSAEFKDDGTNPLPKNFVTQGKTWDFDSRVAVALNMGNKVNLDRLMKGYGLTREQVDNLVKPLSKADWEAIQMIWDSIGTLWPGVAGAHERINFFTPVKVDATPFTTPNGVQMKGGYYPLKYDHSDNKVYNWTEREKIMEDAHAAILPAAVASGATQSRAKDVGRLPLRLETKVAFEHIEWALQYANYAEIVTDIDTILRRQDMRDLIQAKMGFEKYKAMRTILQSIAHPNMMSDASSLEKGMYHLQSMVASYALGLNPYVALQQPLALFNYMSAEGGLVKGGATWLLGAKAFMQGSGMEVLNNMAPGLKEHYMFMLRDKKEQLKHAAMELKVGTGSAMHTLYVAKDAAVKGAQVLMAVADALIAIPGWLGSYYARINDGMSPENAAIEATKILSMYTPLNRTMDKTVLQNKKGLGAMYTFLTGFAVKAQNEMGTYGRAWKAGKISFDEYLSHVILARLMPVIMTHMMYSLISSDDREKEDTWLKRVFGIFMDSIAYRFIGSPILRDVVQVGTNTAQKVVLDKKAYDRNPFQLPATAAIELFHRGASSMTKYVQDMEDDEKRLKGMLAFGELLTFGTKIPVFKLVSNVLEGSRQNYDLDGTPANIFLKPDPELRRKK